MTDRAGSTRRLQLVLAVVAVVAVVGALAVLTGDSEPEPVSRADGEPAATRGGSSGGAGQSIAPAAGDHDHGHAEHGEEVVLDAGPGARRVYMPGKGWATVVDPQPGDQAPPDLSQLPENPNPPTPPPEELPQTARWKLGKTERIHEVMRGRAERLEQQLADARRRGDDEEAGRIEVLLARTRQRVESLAADMERLREEAAREPSEEEVLEQWREETGLTPDQLIERNRNELPPPPGDQGAAPPPP